MNILIFGKGSVGKFIATKLNCDIFSHTDDMSTIKGPYDAVIWCNGLNCNDTIYDISNFDNVMNVNVNYIVKTLHWLLDNNKICDGSKLCVLSSIWEKFTRENKFSYTVSKAALNGLVRSCAVDLYKRNILINSILPGPLDNEMTRSHVKNLDDLNFVSLDDLFNMIKFLCIENKTITGQSFVLDSCNTTLKFS